jgi:hypothetical protein
MKAKRWLGYGEVLVLVMTIAAFFFIGIGVHKRKEECERSGGALVRGAVGMECIARK